MNKCAVCQTYESHTDIKGFMSNENIQVCMDCNQWLLSLGRNSAPVCDVCGKECYYDGDNDWQYSCECNPGWYDGIDTGQ